MKNHFCGALSSTGISYGFTFAVLFCDAMDDKVDLSIEQGGDEKRQPEKEDGGDYRK